MRDFTLATYGQLMAQLKSAGYQFVHAKQYHELQGEKKIALLRQDVDYSKKNALAMAKIQAELGIVSTFYFRTIPLVYDADIMQQIADLGHEIGYHYETMDKANGDLEKAYQMFCEELTEMRKIYPVETVCMHGSPLSKYDNRSIWNNHRYQDLELIFEPYFDLDFNKFYYLTDTGRRWDGDKVSVRDKAMASNPVTNPVFNKLRFNSTNEIISALKDNDLPERVMMTCHPNRWNDDFLPWTRELVMQNLKNSVKYFLIKLRN